MNHDSSYLAVAVEVASGRRVAVTWADGLMSHYHFIWLRQQVFHPAFGRPELSDDAPPRLPDDALSLRVRECRLHDGELVIDWDNDGEQTKHACAWLRDNAYDRELRLARKLKPITWTGAQAHQLPWLDWQEIVNSDEALWEMYAAIRDVGLVRLRNSPVEAGKVTALAQRFGPLRATDFGTLFDIVSRPSASAGRAGNIGASGTNTLGPHTDEGWRYAPPGINFHHCLESTPGAGGASNLCDGLLAAERLRGNDPAAFEFLSTVPLRFAAERNPQERFYAYGRCITVDLDGAVTGIRFSDRTLGVQDLPEDMIEPAYRAFGAFAQELYAVDLTYSHALVPGESHVFDNHRVLHARGAFDTQAGPRRIQQCSVDREECHNRLRILALARGQRADAHMILPSGALG